MHIKNHRKIFETNNNTNSNNNNNDNNILFNKISAHIGTQKIILAHIANKIRFSQRKK